MRLRVFISVALSATLGALWAGLDALGVRPVLGLLALSVGALGALTLAVLASVHRRSARALPGAPLPAAPSTNASSTFGPRRVWLNGLAALSLGALSSGARAQGAPLDVAPAPDTLAAELRYDDVALGVARAELRAATSWRRLLPAVRASASVSTRGQLFAPVNAASGYDPYAAALARWPGDAWSLSVSWGLDQLLDGSPRRAAEGAVRLARGRRAVTEARLATRVAADEARQLEGEVRLARERERLADDAAALGRRSDALAAERAFAERDLALRRDLLRLAELDHRAGGEFEPLARARLALLQSERALAGLDADAADVRARSDAVRRTQLALKVGGVFDAQTASRTHQ